MSNLQVKGKIVQIGQAQQVSDRFKKREFALDISEPNQDGQVYPNFAKLQCIQNKCDLLDALKEGQEVTVHFNIRGAKFEKDGKVNYFTNLEAWKIETAAQQSQPQPEPQPQSAPAANQNSGPLPF